MVTGLNLFKDTFRDYTDCYTIIGGTACDILMTEADVPFRETKDIDMILVLEDKDKAPEFAETFWRYVKAGGCKFGWKNSEETHFYRFTEPKDGYPKMIELFSRKPEYELQVDSGIIPVHIDEMISSLSAILLNDDFYNFMLSGRRVVNGLSVLSAEYIIPFKMYAWLDLKGRKEHGEHVNSRDYKKHKYGVFRLLSIIDVDAHIVSSGSVRDSISSFLELIRNEDLYLENIGVDFNREEAVEIMKRIYL